jgi:hypothetical protein
MVKCLWSKRDTEYLGFIVGSGIVRTSTSKQVSIMRYWPLPETQKQVKYFVAFYSFCRKFIRLFVDWSTLLTDLCWKSLSGQALQLCYYRHDCFRDLKGDNDFCPGALDSQISPGSGIHCCERSMRVRLALPGYYFKIILKVAWDLALIGFVS